MQLSRMAAVPLMRRQMLLGVGESSTCMIRVLRHAGNEPVFVGGSNMVVSTSFPYEGVRGRNKMLPEKTWFIAKLALPARQRPADIPHFLRMQSPLEGYFFAITPGPKSESYG